MCSVGRALLHRAVRRVPIEGNELVVVSLRARQSVRVQAARALDRQDAESSRGSGGESSIAVRSPRAGEPVRTSTQESPRPFHGARRVSVSRGVTVQW